MYLVVHGIIYFIIYYFISIKCLISLLDRDLIVEVGVNQQKSDGHVKLDKELICVEKKFKQPVSCVVLNSVCKINFFVHFIVSKTFEINTCPTLHVRPTFAVSPLVQGRSQALFII